MVKKMTIGGLAGMVQRGFEQTATKEDVLETREVLARAIKDLETYLSASLSYKEE